MSEKEQNMHLQLLPEKLQGDVLEKVAMHVPIIDLVSASCVSREWRRAVHSSVLYRPVQRPWLILRDLRSPKSSSFDIHAFDPYSHSWISFSGSSLFEMVTPCILRRPGGDRFYALLFRKMAISIDPFGAKWEEAMPLRMWRADPVVAEVGQCVVVVGGGCFIELDFGEEGSVEVYNKQTGIWESAGQMPVVFERSTCATWLSVVASDKRLYVMERKTGWLSWFEPERRIWGPSRQLRPDPAMSAWAIATAGKEKLLLVGVGRAAGGTVKVRVWEVEGDNLRVVNSNSEEMPTEVVDRLFPFGNGDDATWRRHSVEVCGTEHGGYVCNPSEMRNGVALFELSAKCAEEGRIVVRWEWVPSPERVGDNPRARILCASSPVGLDDISPLRRL